MAAKITVDHESEVSRQDTFRIHPDDAKDGRNSRMIPAPNYADSIRRLAISIGESGQLQPCLVRRNEDKSLTLIAGYTRKAAVKLLREGFEYTDPLTGETTKYHKPDATLWVKVQDCGIDEAFLASVKENLERTDTTDLQEALAQSEIRTTMGWSNANIARFYGYKNQNRVAALEKLLILPKDVQERVHNGQVALSIALLSLEGITDEERAILFDGAADPETGKVSGPAFKALLRELLEKKAPSELPVAPIVPVKPLDKPEEGPTGAEKDKAEGGVAGGDASGKVKKTIKRNAKDLERFFAGIKDDPTAVNAGGAELLNVLVLWFKGKRNDEYLRTAINEYCNPTV